MTSPKVLDERCCKKLSFCIYRLVFQTFLSVILEPSCKVIKEMRFRIVLSSVDHLPSPSAYIFYENPWMFVPCPQCIAIPYTLCIWIFPLWPPDSVSPGSILRFCRLIYSVSLGSYSVSVASFTRFPYSSTHFLVWKCPFCPASRKVSSILRSSTFPTSFSLSFPRQSLRAIFLVSCHTYSTVPSHPASSPFSPLPHLVINRVLLPIPVLVGLLKAK